jgi:hypothetical protein
MLYTVRAAAAKATLPPRMQTHPNRIRKMSVHTWGRAWSRMVATGLALDATGPILSMPSRKPKRK